VRENTPGGKVDDRLRYFTMDAEGNILRRTEGTFEGGRFTQDDAERLRTEQYAFANGQYVAAGRFDGKTDVLGQMNAYASTDVGTYKVTVQAGDTLRGLAQRLYGNSNLWYVLAEANAIDDDSGLVAGATLNVPDVKANTNDANTFKPFNASEAIGSTTPSLPYIPKPPESGCGTLGMIIMVVVAIVVTIYTAGAAAGLMGAATASGATAASAGAFAAGTGVLAGTYGTAAMVVGSAAGAFAGSLASQGVGSAMGQTSFSWRNVAASTVAGAATAGFGTFVSGAPAVVAAVATAAVGNVSSYVANKLVGNEASFSWRSVAASAVAAGITQQLAPTIARSIGVDATQYGQAITSGITGGIVSAHVRQGIVGGAVDYQDVFVDAFGNAVNGALMQRGQAALAARSQSDRPSLSASIGGTAALSDPDYRADWLYGTDVQAGADRAAAQSITSAGDISDLPDWMSVGIVMDEFAPRSAQTSITTLETTQVRPPEMLIKDASLVMAELKAAQEEWSQTSLWGKLSEVFDGDGYSVSDRLALAQRDLRDFNAAPDEISYSSVEIVLDNLERYDSGQLQAPPRDVAAARGFIAKTNRYYMGDSPFAIGPSSQAELDYVQKNWNDLSMAMSGIYPMAVGHAVRALGADEQNVMAAAQAAATVRDVLTAAQLQSNGRTRQVSTAGSRRVRPSQGERSNAIITGETSSTSLGKTVHGDIPARTGATLGYSRSFNYRATFFEANPGLEGNVVVHHAVEQQVLTRYPGVAAAEQIHSLENLRGIPKEINSDLHLSAIRREWNKFYRETPNATLPQLLRKATEIDSKYGSQFNPKVN
ncbi:MULTISPECIES: LysM domain-containing protein, partial [unclassified Xanthomonas]|uniref:LysM peptidoglycan-binding domain-containing protein n=1 Tax=unclassified Xanthomonas TaxID=2643310 RepID=UPI002B223D61